MSDQNPPAASVPEVPSAPQQSAGPPGPAQESFGTAPAVETLGSAPAAPDPIPAQSVRPDTTKVPEQPTPGAESQESAPPPPPGSAPETAAKPRRKGTGLLVTAAVLVVILLGIGAYYYFVLRTSPGRANVGDCLSGTEDPGQASDIKLTDCGDSSATFKVLKKIENKPKPAATDQSACDGTATTDTFWFGQEGKAGTILCLSKLNE